MKLFKDILYKLLAIQEKLLRQQLSKTIGAKSLSKRKKHFYLGCVVDLNSLADEEKQNLENEISLILKQCEYEPEKLLKYIETQGTPVYRVLNANKILNPIGENEGFLYPQKGHKALYISLSITKKILLKTSEMMVISPGEINKYYFIYNFYNWYAFKHNIAGLETDSQELLKKYLFTQADTKELQLADLYKLKDAIKQDKSAIEFVVKLCRNYDGAKQALQKIEQNGSAKL